MSALLSETLITQEKLPTLEGASTDTDRLELPAIAVVPEVGLTWHQFWLVWAVQLETPEPVLDRVKGWLEGVAPPLTPLKEKVVGERLRWEEEGGGLEPVWVTWTVPEVDSK